MSKRKILLAKGMIWSKDANKRDGRKGYNSLDEASDALTKQRCCGVDCCEGVLYLPTPEGTVVKISVQAAEGGGYELVFADQVAV